MPDIPQWSTLEELGRHATSASQLLAVNTFRDSVLLNAFRFKNLTNKAGEDFLRTTDLPQAQVRGLNQDFTSTRGASGRDYEALRIYGNQFQEDDAAQRMGISSRSHQLALHALAVRLLVEYHLIYGDPISSEMQMGGLQYWAENSGDPATSISAGSGSGGSALSRRLFRRAVDECDRASHIVCSQEMRNILMADVEAETTWDNVQLASRKERIGYYDGIPIIPMERDSFKQRILDFNEAAVAGPATATSLYIVSHREDGCYPFQNGLLDTFALAKVGSMNVERLQWLLAFAAVDTYSVIRVKHVANTAMVA